MTTSGIYSFSVSRDTVVRQSMLNIEKLGETEAVSPQALIDCSNVLNMLVKQWMGKRDFAPGLKMWTRSRADLFLSATQYQYALGPSGDNWAGGVAAVAGANFATSPLTVNAAAAATTLAVGTTNIANLTVGDYVVVQLDSGTIYATTVATKNAIAGTFTIPVPGLPSAASANNYAWNYTTKAQRPEHLLTAILRDVNSVDTPLNFMTLQVYEALPNKVDPNNLSDPTAVYYETQLTNGQLYIDCGGAQDVTKQIHCVFLRPVQDLVNPTDTFDYPQAWFLPLAWGLSKQIAPMFNAVWTKEMQDNLDESLAIAKEGDPETTEMYFQPNA